MTFRRALVIVAATCSTSVAALISAKPMEAMAESSKKQQLETCLARTIDPIGGDRCYSEYARSLEDELETALAATREFLVRRWHETNREDSVAMQDNRRDPTYLDRSQTAWREFVDQDCTMQGGLLGGGNSWVSRERRRCYIEALEKRIAFLESISSGEFTAP